MTFLILCIFVTATASSVPIRRLLVFSSYVKPAQCFMLKRQAPSPQTSLKRGWEEALRGLSMREPPGIGGIPQPMALIPGTFPVIPAKAYPRPLRIAGLTSPAGSILPSNSPIPAQVLLIGPIVPRIRGSFRLCRPKPL